MLDQPWWIHATIPLIVVEESYYDSGEQRKELNPYEQMIMDHDGHKVVQAREREGVMGP